MTALQIIWFVLIGVLLTGYAILAGFDLGVGIWHLFNRSSRERRLMLGSIGPFWDSNQVWLLTGGGAIFAAFPPVYASVFSGLYLALVLLLLAIIARSVAIEFRDRVESPAWIQVWDSAFGLGSTVAALLLGVALGNMIRGMPLDAAGNYTGGFFDLLHPFALVIGLNGLAMFALHGALFLALKTEGPLHARALGWARAAWIPYVVLFVVGTVWNYSAHPHNLANYRAYPPLLWVPLMVLCGLGLIRWLLGRGRLQAAFVLSAVTIASNMGTVGLTLFPNLVPNPWNPRHALTAFNASSSQHTLTVMLVLALIGVPLVLAYLVYIFRKFRGKVTLEGLGY